MRALVCGWFVVSFRGDAAESIGRNFCRLLAIGMILSATVSSLRAQPDAPAEKKADSSKDDGAKEPAKKEVKKAAKPAEPTK